ncbi:MAG: zonular occludens toxin [Steroidobacteraceae bacterium]|nr:zonular occludens toxin [Steroidobacteraceae bacterium]
MITLITGAPGAGKTSALVTLLAELAKGRPIYCDGIPDLKVTHTALDDPKSWPETVPDGSVIVIDEVQRVWRPAGPGSKVPHDISMLETHRHRGLDFFIVTQHPKLLHSNVRNLVGRHVHLREMGVLGRWWYEWPEAADPGTWRSAPVKKKYRLSKASFALYKSASEHIKPVRSIPPALYVLAGSLVLVVIVGVYAYRSVSSKVAPPAPSGQPDAAPVSYRTAGAPNAPITGGTLVASFAPRVSDQPLSAPAYDHLRKVVAMPRVVGGYCIGNNCQCQTQQGTQAEISDEACRAWVARRPFDPYLENIRPVEQGTQAVNPAARQEQGVEVANSAPL